MSSKKITVLVDTAAFVLLILLAATGLLVHYSIPPRSGPLAQVWGLSRHQWGDLHFAIALLLLTTLAVHLLLHRRFLGSLFRDDTDRLIRYRIVLGVTGLVALMAFVATLFYSG